MAGPLRFLPAPLAYLALAVLGHLPAFRSLSTTTQCACEDAPQTDWFLAWTPYALLEGRSPWFSQHLVAPEGVNLMWNTLLPLPGVLAAPVTLTAGPLAAHTLLAVLAFAGSATSMWWVAGRFATWPWARFAAGLLYGFSPYLVAQGTGHLNLSLVALPPVVLLLAHELLVRQRRRAGVAGALLGVVAFAQLMTTEEVLASTFVVAVAGTVVLLLQHRPSRAQVRHAVVGLGTAAGVLTVLAAWPLRVQFLGPRRVTEPVQDASPYAADLLGAVVPTVHQVLGTDATSGWGGNVSENGSYLGGPLLVLLAGLAWRWRSVPVVRWAAVVGVVAWVLSLGERLHVAGTPTDLPLPFAPVVGAAGAAQPGRGAALAPRRALRGAGARRRARPAARGGAPAGGGRAAGRGAVRAAARAGVALLLRARADAGVLHLGRRRAGAGGVAGADLPGAAVPHERADAVAGGGRLPLPVRRRLRHHAGGGRARDLRRRRSPRGSGSSGRRRPGGSGRSSRRCGPRCCWRWSSSARARCWWPTGPVPRRSCGSSRTSSGAGRTR